MKHPRRRVLAVAALVWLAAAGHAPAEESVNQSLASETENVPPVGYAFHVNSRRVTLETAVGPVQLKSAQFNQQKPDEIEALLDFYCEEGKDQSVTYEIFFLDARGTPVLTIKDKKGIEETDNTTFKKKQKIQPGLLDSVKTFKVTFSSVPD